MIGLLKTLKAIVFWGVGAEPEHDDFDPVLLTHMLSLEEQNAIVFAAKAEHDGDWWRAAWFRDEAGYAYE